MFIRFTLVRIRILINRSSFQLGNLSTGMPKTNLNNSGGGQEISDALHKRGRSSSAGRRNYINALSDGREGREEEKPKNTVPVLSMQDLADTINALGNNRRPKPQPKTGDRPEAKKTRFAKFFFR